MNINLDLAANVELNEKDLRELGVTPRKLKELFSSAEQKKADAKVDLSGLIIQSLLTQNNSEE